MSLLEKTHAIGDSEFVFSSLGLNERKLPVMYVKSEIVEVSGEPGFAHLLERLRSQPQPGFFFTRAEEGDLYLPVRWGLNRHGVFSSDSFKDSKGNPYRDVDAKGIGYVHGIPMRVLPVQSPHMENDVEMRGIQHCDYAEEDWLIGEELSKLELRIARPVAQIELFELVDVKGKIVPRQAIGDKLGINLDRVRPMITLRAMGTTSRVWDLSLSYNPSYNAYRKEMVDDAMSLVSSEIGAKLSPRDYVVWFIDTLSSMVGKMHANDISPDFRKQIHQGLHNVTLDCRLIDLHAYDTPGSIRRRTESLRRSIAENPRLAEFYRGRVAPTREQVEANNREVEQIDRENTFIILNDLARGVNGVYPIGDELISERGIWNRLNLAYWNEVLDSVCKI